MSELTQLVIAFAALYTAYTAARGLHEWRIRLRGETDIEIARGLLERAIGVRITFWIARSRLIHFDEFPPGYQNNDPNHQTQANAYAHVYQNRLAPLREAFAEFQSYSVKAEAVWGRNVQRLVANLRSPVNVLWASVQAIVDNKRSGGQDFIADREYATRVQSDLGGTELIDGTEYGEAQPLSREFSIAFAAVESFCRDRMRWDAD